MRSAQDVVATILLLLVCAGAVGAQSTGPRNGWLGCPEIRKLKDNVVEEYSDHNAVPKYRRVLVQLDMQTTAYVKTCSPAYVNKFNPCYENEEDVEIYRNLRHHPNVVFTYGYCHEDRTIVQEPLSFWERGSKEFLEAPLVERVQKSIDIARSLQALDSAGFVFCDLAPAQWLHDAAGTLKLLDMDKQPCKESDGHRYNGVVQIPASIKHTKGRHVWIMPEVMRFATMQGVGVPAYFQEAVDAMRRRWNPASLADLPTIESVISDLVQLQTRSQRDSEL